jgi:dienelactone hydrolase
MLGLVIAHLLGTDAPSRTLADAATPAATRPWASLILPAATVIAFAGVAAVIVDSPLAAPVRAAGIAIAVAAALVVVASLRHNGAALDAVLCLVGLIAGTAAAGYAAARVIEGNWWLALVPVAGTIACVGLVVVGSLGALRRVSRGWRLLAIPIALVLAQFVIFPLTFGSFGSHGPRTPLERTTPANARAVAIPTDDGVVLQGWYMPAINGASVVLLPGAGGNRSHTLTHAAALASHGYGVLALDARGTGDSGGTNNLWGWQGVTDIRAAVAWLVHQPDVRDERVGLVGLSMGGEQAVTAAAQLDGVRAVVAEGVQARMSADTWYVTDDIRGSIERVVTAEMWAVADLWTDGGPPPSLRDCVALLDKRPILIIAADAPDEHAVAADLARRADTVEVWQTSGVGHTQALTQRPDEWHVRVGAFLDRSLLGR